MSVIKAEDLVNSFAEALQYISYYHPKYFIDAMYEAYQSEESKPAKDAMVQNLINSTMSAIGKRPICQETWKVS
ncbi:fumarate hydratase, partial [Francisella tularensis subsp. holarctica]|uniref:fumarate hydratase n=1 Tax=Francisella tularensis TaxID=263 RepID=UPI002381CF11